MGFADAPGVRGAVNLLKDTTSESMTCMHGAFQLHDSPMSSMKSCSHLVTDHNTRNADNVLKDNTGGTMACMPS